MSIFSNMHEDSVFAENTIIVDNVRLKDSKPIREAFILQELANMPKEELRKYVKSSTARALVENEIISPAALEGLAKEAYSDRGIEFMVCHMAKENDDGRWDELVRHRAEERKLMDDLIRDYGARAADMCDGYRKDFADKVKHCEHHGEEGEHGSHEGHPHHHEF